MSILNYSCYNESTGVITSHQSGLQADADLNAPYVLGHYNSQLYEIVDGAAVSKADSVIAAQNKVKVDIEMRTIRDGMLADSDWTQMPDVRFSVGVQSAWATYRQSLRNVPANNADCISINDIVWPTPPT